MRLGREGYFPGLWSPVRLVWGYAYTGANWLQVWHLTLAWRRRHVWFSRILVRRERRRWEEG